MFRVTVDCLNYPGPLPAGELARRLDLDPPPLSPLLKRLAAAGLVTRRRDEHSRIRSGGERDGQCNPLPAPGGAYAIATAVDYLIDRLHTNATLNQLNPKVKDFHVEPFRAGYKFMVTA